MLHVAPWASTSSNSHSIQYGSVSTNVPSMSHRTAAGRRRARSDRLVEDMRHRGYWLFGEAADDLVKYDRVDGQGGPATFEDGFVDRSWRDAVTSTEVCASDGIRRQAKAAIDQRGAHDGPP